MVFYFDKKIRSDERDELKKRLIELKEISEETGVSLENVINYVGYDMIVEQLDDSLRDIRDSIDDISIG